MTTLPRTLGLRDLIFLTIGSVIGSGIFLVPGAVLRQVHGFILPALIVWLTGGVLSLLGALTYGELGAMKPAAGGLYVYIRDCFGDRKSTRLNSRHSQISYAVFCLKHKTVGEEQEDLEPGARFHCGTIVIAKLDICV